jgi:hypothetical protein
VIFFGIDFYIKFRKAILEDFDGFRSSFSWLFGSKPDPNPKRRKDEKPMFYLRKTYVLEGPGLSIFIKNRLKTMSEREAESEPTFSWFLMDFGLHFEVHFREKAKKNDVENEEEFGDGKKAKKERKGVIPGSSAAGRRASRSQFWYAFYLHSGMHAFIRLLLQHGRRTPLGRAPYCVRFAMPAGLIAENGCNVAGQSGVVANIIKNMSKSCPK